MDTGTRPSAFTPNRCSLSPTVPVPDLSPRPVPDQVVSLMDTVFYFGSDGRIYRNELGVHVKVLADPNRPQVEAWFQHYERLLPVVEHPWIWFVEPTFKPGYRIMGLLPKM